MWFLLAVFGSIVAESPVPIGHKCTQVREWRVNNGKMERHYDFWIFGDTGYCNLWFAWSFARMVWQRHDRQVLAYEPTAV